MNKTQTQANLAIYLGETYSEIEVRTLKGRSLLKRSFYWPQISFKSALTQIKNALDTDSITINSIYIVCRYFEKLKHFRLGGSVVQITHKGFENSYFIENTTKYSLAASSLIYNYEDHCLPEWKNNEHCTTECLTALLDKIKKTNAEANKVVISLNQKCVPEKHTHTIVQFFKENDFKVFIADDFPDLASLRKQLIFAGTEGTQNEIFTEIKDTFPESTIAVWINDSFKPDYTNLDLYFSWTDFLGHYLQNKKIKSLVHFDIETFFCMSTKTETCWQSPWGTVVRNHFKTQPIGFHPLTEIYIDNSSLLELSKTPAATEPGPMIAGRGTKTLLLDAFYENIFSSTSKSVSDLFPNLNTTLVKNKISAQFKAMENVQSEHAEPIKLDHIKKIVTEVIEMDLIKNDVQLKESLFTGHLSTVFALDHINQNTTTWTDLIFDCSNERSTT